LSHHPDSISNQLDLADRRRRIDWIVPHHI